MRKHIPNLITLLNLLCGCFAIVFAVNGALVTAAYLVILGIFFDFFDGLAARLLQVQSSLGVQLDSLADLVTSGVVPGVIMYKLLQLSAVNQWTTNSDDIALHSWQLLYNNPVPFLGFLITLGAAYRLAKFNIDEEQSDVFKGLPTPANALFVVSLPLILFYENNESAQTLIANEWFLIGVILLLTLLMNVPVKLFALKFKNWNFQENSIRYTFLLLSLIALITVRFLAIPLLIVLYVLISVILPDKEKVKV